MMLRVNIIETENVPRKISYKTGHSQVSLCVPIGLKLFKRVQITIFAFFHVFGSFFANISRSRRLRGKLVGVENVPSEI